jgi:Zn-dependent protease
LPELTPDRIAWGITTYVVLLFSLSFHESAHAWMASRFGDDTARRLGRVSLNPAVHFDFVGTLVMPLVQFLGPSGIPVMAWAKPTPVEARNFRPGMLARGQVLVAAAGPASNVILALLFTAALFVAVRLGLDPASRDPLVKLVGAGVFINVALAIFNLVPLPPLDGSWVVSWGLPRSIAQHYDRFMEPYGQWILLGLFVTGALSWITSPVIFFVQQILYQVAL